MYTYRFDINPPITRGEIRELWDTLLTNKDGTLSWMQFISQFGFTGQTPSYTNSFKSPPKQGDVDYSLRSKRFNSDKEIQQDGTRQKVNICFVVSMFTSCASSREKFCKRNSILKKLRF